MPRLWVSRGLLGQIQKKRHQNGSAFFVCNGFLPANFVFDAEESMDWCGDGPARKDGDGEYPKREQENKKDGGAALAGGETKNRRD